MLKKELGGRKIKLTRSMDAEERFHNKRMGYVKYCIHMKHNVPLESTTTNWTMKYVSIKGQIVVKTVQSGNLKEKKREEKESGSSTLSKTKHSDMNKMASGSKDICLRYTGNRDDDTKDKEVTFIILQKI